MLYRLKEIGGKMFCDDCKPPHKILTPEEQQKYIQGGYGLCPYCESAQIEGMGSFNCQDATVWQDVGCLVCEREWQDVYYLVTIDQKAENGDSIPGIIVDPSPTFARTDDENPICSQCKSDDVRRDAYASWDKERGEWVLEETYD